MNEGSPKSGFEIALRCLQNPLTWLSIILLLLNDHLLKVVAPSWLTGKLSDFAGLFFFPFLLAAALSLLLDPLHCPVRWIGRIAFGLAGVWFTFTQVIPWANVLTARLVSLLVGSPIQLVPDATDLLALCALWPAWRLWNRPTQNRPGRMAWVALAIGALASLATTPREPPSHILSLASQSDVLYAADADLGFVAQSEDGGCTWRKIYKDSEKPRDILQNAMLPLELCSPSEPQHCYRISGQEQVEISTDGGLSWEVAWRIPPGRRDFMERFVNWKEGGWKKEIDLGPYDMIFFRQNGTEYLLVAMGNEGVMRRRMPDGDWERLSVWYAHPTPYVDKAVAETLLIMQREVAICCIAALLALQGSCAVSWLTIGKQGGTSAREDSFNWWPLQPLTLATVLGSLTGAAFVWIWETGVSSAGLVLLPPGIPCLSVFLLLITVGFVLTCQRIAETALAPMRISLVVVSCLSTSLGVFVASLLPWVLWARGVITSYETARTIAVPFALAVLACGLYATHRMAKRVAR